LLIEPMQTPQTEERRPERFAAYIAARRFDPPRPLLIRAAGLAEPKDHALDAGAGALNATRYLLSAGFKHVTALDSSPASQTVAAELPREQVRFVLSRFEDFDYPDRAYEFVNAEFSLPFISAAAFPSVFTKLMASVKIGAQDGIVTPSYGEGWRQEIPAAKIDLIPAAGHFPHWEQPEEFVERLSAFVDGRNT
jgi:pimeloyl-ACP methyl ester carboxylesterase